MKTEAGSTGVRALRVPDMEQKLRVSRTTLWRMEREGELPPRREFSPGGSVFWLEDEVDAWLKSRPVK